MDLRNRPVSEIMRTEIATLAPKDTLDLTQDLMGLGRIRHMPVLDDGRLVGIVSSRDLLAASLTNALGLDKASCRSFLRLVEVGKVMTREVVTIGPDTQLAEAARMLIDRKIGCLPVVDAKGVLIGLVTPTDLMFVAFLDVTHETEGRVTDMSKHSSFSEWTSNELRELRSIRDELRVQAHLGKAEMRDRWNALECAFETLEQRAKRTTRAAEQPLQQLEDDLRKLARDLREGFRRIRDSVAE